MAKTIKSKLLFFIFLFSVMLSYTVSASVIYENNFPTNISFASDGWIYSTTCAGDNNKPYPLPSPFGSFAFAHEGNNSCGFGFTRSIARMTQNSTSGVIQLNFNAQISNDTVKINQPIRAFMYDILNGGNFIQLDISSNSSFITCTGFNCARCNMTFLYEAPLITNINLYVDLENNYYTALLNGSSYGCENIYFNGSKAKKTGISAIKLQENIDLNENLTAYIDNIKQDNEALIITLLGVSDSCLNGAECITGKCEGGYCVQKTGKETCVNSIECISGACVNEKCSKPSASQLLRASKNEQFGDDSDTNNFISLFLATALLIAISWAGRSLIAVIIGFIVFFAVSLFFTIIGWLSVWIMFGVFFVTLIGGVIALIMNVNK